jgi:hypothetical protein
MTQILILATLLIWIAYDVWVYFKKGNAETESATIFKWSYRIRAIVFIIGVLAGHFIFGMHMPTEFQTDDHDNIIYQAGVDIKAGQILTVDVDGLFVPKVTK